MLRQRAFRERRRIDAEAPSVISANAFAWWRASEVEMAAGSTTKVNKMIDSGPYGLDLAAVTGFEPTLVSGPGGEPYVNNDGGNQPLRQTALWRYFNINGDWTIVFGINADRDSRDLITIGRNDAKPAGEQFIRLTTGVGGNDMGYDFQWMEPTLRACTLFHNSVDGGAESKWYILTVSKIGNLMRGYYNAIPSPFGHVSAALAPISIAPEQLRIGWGGDFSPDIRLTDFLILDAGLTAPEVVEVTDAIASYSPTIYAGV